MRKDKEQSFFLNYDLYFLVYQTYTVVFLSTM